MRPASIVVRNWLRLALIGLALLGASLAAITAAPAKADGKIPPPAWVRTTDKNGAVFGSPAHPSVHYTKGQQFNDYYTVSNPVGPGVAKDVYIVVTINSNSLQSYVKSVQVLPPPGFTHWATCTPPPGPVYTCHLRESLNVGETQLVKIAYYPANGKFSPTVTAGSAS